MSVRYALLGTGIAVLSACAAVGPDYDGPPASAVSMEATFPSASATSADVSNVVAITEPPTEWWRQLADPLLDELMSQAVTANYDLRVAAANIDAARAILAQVDTRRLPTVNANGVIQERREAGALLPTADPHDALPTTTSSTWSLDLAWELDLFGRVRRSIEAAVAEVGSLEALRHDVLTSVLAAVGRAYIDMRGAQVRLDVANRNVSVQRQTLDLVVLLNREGAATELDVARARTQLLNSQATMPRLEAAVRSAQNRLTTLTGQSPGTLDGKLAQHRPLPPMPPLVAIGAPADLLRRRPDIQAAERALAATTARIGVATADLFPTVSMGGRVGVGAAHPSDLVTAAAPFLALGPSITWNLFDREAIYARIRQADSAMTANLARYEATVTTALEEVDTALSSWRNERNRRDQLAEARTASRDASRLARLRYREGAEDFLTVLDAERNLLLIDDQLALSEIQLAQSLVDIHLALGGGWESDSAASSASAALTRE